MGRINNYNYRIESKILMPNKHSWWWQHVRRRYSQNYKVHIFYIWKTPLIIYLDGKIALPLSAFFSSFQWKIIFHLVCIRTTAPFDCAQCCCLPLNSILSCFSSNSLLTGHVEHVQFITNWWRCTAAAWCCIDVGLLLAGHLTDTPLAHCYC